MERILALQTLSEMSFQAEPIAGSSDSNVCSSETNSPCSSQSVGCSGLGVAEW